TTWEWDGHDWSAGAVGPGQRTLMSMATDMAGNTMLLGGQAVQAMSFGSHSLSDQWHYDGQQRRQEAPPGPPARGSVAPGLDTGRARLATAGCEDGVNGSAHVWEHDGRAWSEHHVAVEPAPVSLARMCFDPAHGVCVLFGGLLGFAPQAETWLWNGKCWRHAQPALAPP